MGWTFTHRTSGQSIKDFFSYTFGDNYKILDVATVKRTTSYMLVKRMNVTDAEGNALPDYLFAAVILLRYARGHYNFGYKDMDETVGPFEAECPERILKALEAYPPMNEYAREWRERCWANIEQRKNRPKLKSGDIILFHSPLQFNDGIKRAKFRVTGINRGKADFVDQFGYGVNLSQRVLGNIAAYTINPLMVSF